jgi:hypothetical protein
MNIILCIETGTTSSSAPTAINRSIPRKFSSPRQKIGGESPSRVQNGRTLLKGSGWIPVPSKRTGRIHIGVIPVRSFINRFKSRNTFIFGQVLRNDMQRIEYRPQFIAHLVMPSERHQSELQDRMIISDNFCPKNDEHE